MGNAFRQEYRKFEESLNVLSRVHSITKNNEHVYLLGPQRDKIDLTIAVIIHGNEIGGLKALNLFLEDLVKGSLELAKSVCFILGNLKAADQNVRYLERDLNRCFGGCEVETYEESIARVIEPYLARSRYYIDLHQTVGPTASDFYIFPEIEKNISWAHALSSKTPIVVHDVEFSKDGMCSDSYVCQEGGTGITLEMGQIGDDSYVEKARDVLKRALIFEDQALSVQEASSPITFTWGQVIYSSCERRLVPGLTNFSPVTKNQLLATDPAGDIFATDDGFVLFPKYDSSSQASELCRIIRKQKVKPLNAHHPLRPSFSAQ